MSSSSSAVSVSPKGSSMVVTLTSPMNEVELECSRSGVVARFPFMMVMELEVEGSRSRPWMPTSMPWPPPPAACRSSEVTAALSLSRLRLLVPVFKMMDRMIRRRRVRKERKT